MSVVPRRPTPVPRPGPAFPLAPPPHQGRYSYQPHEFVGFERRDDRVEVTVRVTARNSGMFTEHPLANLKSGGFFLACGKSLPLGTLVDVVFRFDSERREVRSRGRVIVENTGGDPHKPPWVRRALHHPGGAGPQLHAAVRGAGRGGAALGSSGGPVLRVVARRATADTPVADRARACLSLRLARYARYAETPGSSDRRSPVVGRGHLAVRASRSLVTRSRARGRRSPVTRSPVAGRRSRGTRSPVTRIAVTRSRGHAVAGRRSPGTRSARSPVAGHAAALVSAGRGRCVAADAFAAQRGRTCLPRLGRPRGPRRTP